MREAAVEKYLVDQVKAKGGRAIKLSPSGAKGIPDRLVILPGAVPVFAEMKRPVGGTLAPAQNGWATWLMKQGQAWCLLSSKARVDAFIARYEDGGYNL